MSTVYVVLNEHTLGYVQTPDTRFMGILHGSVLRGGHDWKNGSVHVTGGIDQLRPATEQDFADYRVECPPGFRMVTAEELDTYRIMSPIRPEPEEPTGASVPNEEPAMTEENDRLFVCVMGTGISWADRKVHEHGDYKRLAFLTFSNLELEIVPGCPNDLRVRIEDYAAKVKARRGQQYQVSTSGQTITLGYAL